MTEYKLKTRNMQQGIPMNQPPVQVQPQQNHQQMSQLLNQNQSPPGDDDEDEDSEVDD
jgi:hypothetical protein